MYFLPRESVTMLPFVAATCSSAGSSLASGSRRRAGMSDPFCAQLWRRRHFGGSARSSSLANAHAIIHPRPWNCFDRPFTAGTVRTEFRSPTSCRLTDEPGSKISRSCPAARYSREKFDAVAETSQFADHLARPHFLRLCADGWSAFLVANALVKNLPDKTTQPVGDGANGLASCTARLRHQPT